MQAGPVSLEMSHQSLLVEPGSLVVDHEEVSKSIQTNWCAQFYQSFLAGDMAGIKAPHKGGLDLLALYFSISQSTDIYYWRLVMIRCCQHF